MSGTPTLGFGDDGSRTADVCWEWINRHEWTGWKLEVVTARPPADMRPVDPQSASLHPWEPDVPRTPAPDTGIAVVEHLTAAVDPRLALTSKSWDLLAIGPKGTGLLKTLHLGSTAEWLLQKPMSPLLIARSGDRVEQALVCADGSAHARRAATTLADVPWISEVSVIVVSVDDGRTDTTQASDELRDVLSGAAAEVRVETLKGNPTRAILHAIEHDSPDLVVVGSRGLTGLGLTVGSTAAAVARAARRSVLVAHSGEEAHAEG